MAAPLTLRETLRRALVRTGVGVLVGSAAGALLTMAGPQAFAALLAPEAATMETVEVVDSADRGEAREARQVARLSQRYGCSSDGLPADTIPARAIVRTDGTVRLAGFDEAWAMHQGTQPGTLIAVCAR